MNTISRLAAAIAAALAAGASQAATLTVTTTLSGTATGDGECSLAEAITNANDDAATFADCSAGAGADTIELPAGQTIGLTSALPELTTDVTIDGRGATITRAISATCSSESDVLTLLVVRFSSLSIESATLSNGCGGSIPLLSTTGTRSVGAVLGDAATLSFQHVTFSGNVGSDAGHVTNEGIAGTILLADSTVIGGEADSFGAILAGGSLVIERSVVENTSGEAATINARALQLLDSELRSNSSGIGVIQATGSASVLVQGSTISGNTTTQSSGYSAGAISIGSGSFVPSVEIQSSTISGNSGGAAGAIAIGAYSTNLTISDSTITDNTGALADGIFVDSYGSFYTSTLTVDRSILSGAGTLCDFGRASNYAGGNNLVTDASCGGLPATQTTIAALDLQALADNGGPTPTHAITAGSSAYDAAGTGCTGLADQRGVIRYAGSACDVGAFEYTLQSGANLVVNALGDDGDGSCTELAGCTLRDAVLTANADGVASTITFSSELDADGTITLSNGQLDVTEALTVTGNGMTIARDPATACVLDGTADSGEFRLIESSQALTISDLVLRDGCADGSTAAEQDGGAIRTVNSSLTLQGVSLIANSAYGSGGALARTGTASATIDDAMFSGNVATNGGAISSPADLTVRDSTFSGNSASSIGGAVRSTGYLSLSRSTITDNSAGVYGGGLDSRGGLAIEDSTFSANTAGTAGGGVHQHQQFPVILGSTLWGNTGGALYLTGGSVPVMRRSLLGDSSGAGDCINGGADLGQIDSTNIATDASCGSAQVATVGEINLGALADNGGTTQTHFPGAGSVLVDAATGCTSTGSGIDQRNQARGVDADGLANSDCDVGAVEVQNVPVVAQVDTVMLSEDDSDASGNVLDNDSDSLLDEDLAVVVSAVAGGTVGLPFSPTEGGQLTLNADGSFSFAPGGAFQSLGRAASQAISVTYTADDGYAQSQTTLEIEVEGSNDAPMASDMAFTPDEDTLVGSSFIASDIDVGDDLLFALGTPPEFGSVSLSPTGDGFLFDPGNDFQDLDTLESREVSFGYQVSDGLAADAATVTLTVTGINDAPVAADGSAAVSADGSVSGSLSVTDAEGDPLTWSLANAPGEGHVSLDGAGGFTFLADGDFDDLAAGLQRQVSFDYRVTDDGNASDVGTITVTVTGVDDAPVAGDQAVASSEDGFVEAAYAASDPDGDALTHAITAPPTRGTVTDLGDGSFRFDANGDFESLDDGETDQVAFTWSASDATATDTGVVTVTINGVNDAPTAQDLTVSTTKDAPVTDSFVGADVDGDTVSFALVGTPAEGVLTGNGDGTFTFDPAGDFDDLRESETRQVQVSYRANDGDVDSELATLTLIVTGGDTPPVAGDESVATDEDTAVVRAFPATDAEGDALSFRFDVVPPQGALTLDADAGSWRYDPAGDFEALDVGDSQQLAFIYTVSDGTSQDSGTVTITINGVNDAPEAVADAATVEVNEILAVSAANGLLANDSDIEGDALSVIAGTVTPAGIGGSLTLNADGSFEYTPPADTTGTAAYEYTVSDGDASAMALLTLTVTEPLTADLMIDKTDGVDIIGANDVLTYTISVVNAGPADVTGALVEDLLPAELENASWTCQAIGTASCGNASGTGNISELVDIPLSDAVTFELTATITDAALPIVNTATVTAPGDLVDEDLSNNSATDTNYPVLVFADGFEAALQTKAFSAGAAKLNGEALPALPDGGAPTLVLRALDRGRVDLAMALVHARRVGGQVELRISRQEHGQWVIGEWTALASETAEVRW